MEKQTMSEEDKYDIELLNAKLEVASKSLRDDETQEEDVITRESFFDDLRKASRRLDSP